jgi:hypothetical protein
MPGATPRNHDFAVDLVKAERLFNEMNAKVDSIYYYKGASRKLCPLKF